MPNANLAEIKEKILKQHEGDEKQLEVIFPEVWYFYQNYYPLIVVDEF